MKAERVERIRPELQPGPEHKVDYSKIIPASSSAVEKAAQLLGKQPKPGISRAELGDATRVKAEAQEQRGRLGPPEKLLPIPRTKAEQPKPSSEWPPRVSPDAKYL